MLNEEQENLNTDNDAISEVYYDQQEQDQRMAMGKQINEAVSMIDNLLG